MKKRVAFVAALIVALYGTAWAASQFIYLGGPIGDQGTFPVLGQSNVIVDASADHLATQPEYAGEALYVTSTGALGAPAKLILPLVQGETKLVYNATTGGQALLVGGPTGTTASVATQSLALVHSPDGVNYTALSGSGGGGGFDAAAYSGGGFLSWDGSTLVWRSVTLGGDLSGTAESATVVAITGGGSDDIQDGGTGIVRIVADEFKSAADSGKQVTSGVVESVADAATWTPLLMMSPAVNSGHTVEYQFNGYDLTDQTDGGPADSFSCIFKYSLTRSNGGTIWYLPYPPNSNAVALTSATPVCNVPFGSQDGGAVISSAPVSFQLVNDGGAVFLQWKGVPGQSPWTSSNPVDIVRRY